MARKKRDSMVVSRNFSGDRLIGYRIPTISDEQKKLLAARFAGAELNQIAGEKPDEEEDDDDDFFSPAALRPQTTTGAN